MLAAEAAEVVAARVGEVKAAQVRLRRVEAGQEAQAAEAEAKDPVVVAHPEVVEVLAVGRPAVCLLEEHPKLLRRIAKVEDRVRPFLLVSYSLGVVLVGVRETRCSELSMLPLHVL